MAEEIEDQEVITDELNDQEEVDNQEDINSEEEDNKDDQEEEDVNKSEEEEVKDSEESESKGEEKASEESLGEIIKAKFPDVNDENLEGYTTQYINELKSENEELLGYQTENRKANEGLVEVLSSDERLGNIVRDMGNGADFVEAFALNVDIEDLKPPEGTPEYKKWEEKKEERKKRLEESQKFKDEFDKNRNESISTLRSFFEENKISEDDAMKFTNKVDEIIGSIKKGAWSKDALTLFWDALNVEQKIKEAETVGKIKGKNEKIETKKKENKGDGIPKLSGGNKIKKQEKKGTPVDNIVDSFIHKQGRF